jgi:hypothetical protein
MCSIARLTPSESSLRGVFPIKIHHLTHAQSDVDAIHGPEERRWPEDNIIVARTLNPLGLPAK